MVLPESFLICSIFVQFSRLVVVPPGVLPSDAINSSPIMFQSTNFGGGGLDGGVGGGAGGQFDYGGVDPELDPELAMAIRVSQEEARSREEARVRFKNIIVFCRPLI